MRIIKCSTFFSCVSIPGRTMMTDTKAPSSSRNEKASREMVELYEEGQHEESRQGAEPHRHDAWRGERRHKSP